ncbi:tetratricopeptide repeat protein [bacterium 1xD42-67]|nr:tetratricopeptide repeat protein [bacterium 1xD42-67]
MFGLFNKKKDGRDNGGTSRARSQSAPQSPWNEAAALMERGQTVEALEKFARTAIQTRDLSRMDLAERWLSDQALLDRAGEETVCRFVAFLTQVLDPMEPVQRQRLWDCCLRALHALGDDTAPRQDISDRYTTECVLLRHMGRMEEALKVAQEGIDRHKAASCYTFAGLCCLDLGDPQGAEDHVRQGLERDPGNLAPCNDLGDYFFERRILDKAMEYYTMVVDRGDAQDVEWAEPSLIFCRWLDSGDPVELERLVLCAASRPQSQRGAQLCQQAREEQKIPYVETFVPSWDATVKMIPNFTAKGTGGEVKLTLSCEEAASAANAVRLAVTEYGKKSGGVHLIVNAVSDPPLDSTLIPDGVWLWDYSPDHNASPAVERPGDAVQMRVKELARSPFHLGEWYDRAGSMCEGLSFDELYGCMVYPPEPDDVRIPADQWLLRVQFAAVCLLAKLGKDDSRMPSLELMAYAGKLPSYELARICLGQLDWPVIPALTLLAWQAKEGLADREQALGVLSLLKTRVPENDYCFFEHALACAMSWFPGESEEFHQNMHHWRRMLEE